MCVVRVPAFLQRRAVSAKAPLFFAWARSQMRPVLAHVRVFDEEARMAHDLSSDGAEPNVPAPRRAVFQLSAGLKAGFFWEE